MAHNINLNSRTGQHSFFCVKEKAWHGLGKIVTDYLNSKEALQFAGLDYVVTKQDLFTTSFNEDGQAMDNTKKVVTHFATMRSDTGAILGIFSIIANDNPVFLFTGLVVKSKSLPHKLYCLFSLSLNTNRQHFFSIDSKEK